MSPIKNVKQEKGNYISRKIERQKDRKIERQKDRKIEIQKIKKLL